jgi:hypothetical protein
MTRLNKRTSPSCTTYSLPSLRITPFSRAACRRRQRAGHTHGTPPRGRRSHSKCARVMHEYQIAPQQLQLQPIRNMIAPRLTMPRAHVHSDDSTPVGHWQRYSLQRTFSLPQSTRSWYAMVSARMNPRSKSEWMTPAACEEHRQRRRFGLRQSTRNAVSLLLPPRP